jgi:hypothetical protein
MVSETWSACLITEGTPSPWFAFVHTTPWPRSLKNLTHESASSFETMSRRFKTMTRACSRPTWGWTGAGWTSECARPEPRAPYPGKRSNAGG